jgi:hypothetical protein
MLRRLLVALIVTVVVAATAYVVLPVALAPLVTRKLQEMVSNHLHARLQIGSLSYRFPYGVIVRDATFAANDSRGGVELLTLERLDLSLAEHPLGEGPIVVEALRVVRPTVRIIRLPDGSIAGRDLAKRGSEAPPDEKRLKLSDVLRLREFTIEGASVVYDDRSRPDSPPMEWRDLSARMNLTPQSASRYGLEFHADNGEMARMDFSGSADVDALHVTVDRLAVSAALNAQSGSTSRLPAPVQDLVRRFGAEGTVRLEVRGEAPLQRLQSSTFQLDGQVDGVRAQPPRQPWALDDLRMRFQARRAEPDRIELRLADFSARGAGASLEAQELLAAFDAAARTWEVSRLIGQVRAVSTNSREAPSTGPTTQPHLLAGNVQFSGAAHGTLGTDQPRAGPRLSSGQFIATLDGLKLALPRFRRPVEITGGQLRWADGAALAQDVVATYGADRFTLVSALVPLSGLETRLEIREIRLDATLAQPSPPYPAPLDALGSKLRPAGPFSASGAVNLYRGRGRFEPDFAIAIYPRGGQLTVTDSNITVGRLQGEVQLAPRAVDVRYLEGQVFGGTVALKGDVSLRDPMRYQAELAVTRADLAQATTALGLVRADGRPRFAGRASTRVQAHGELPPRASAGGTTNPSEILDVLARMRARGTLRIEDGDLWSGHVLSGIVRQVKIAHDALTAGEAAAVFELQDGILHMHEAAISSTALGLHGSGTVGLDGALDLNVIAAPLGDWRRRIQDTGIPIVGDVVGHLAGAIQNIVNQATSELLYQFRVRGNVSEPQVTAVPAPLLTGHAARLFGMMLHGTRADALVAEIQRHVEKDAPTSRPQDNNK